MCIEFFPQSQPGTCLWRDTDEQSHWIQGSILCCPFFHQVPFSPKRTMLPGLLKWLPRGVYWLGYHVEHLHPMLQYLGLIPSSHSSWPWKTIVMAQIAGYLPQTRNIWTEFLGPDFNTHPNFECTQGVHQWTGACLLFLSPVNK